MISRLAPQPWMHAAPTRAVIEALEVVGGAGCVRFVGGCVRDALLGRVSPVDGSRLDIDLATPLEPATVTKALGEAGLRSVPTGIEHGVVTAISKGRPFEIATLRRDVATDGRRAVVAVTQDWSEDARRRDFRLNALYADPDGTLHDPTGEGVADALAGRIVFVGDARARIAEDHLRSLRFFRFTAWYGRGEPDAAALDACAGGVDGLARLAGERIGHEVLKLLAAPDPRTALAAMQHAGVLGAILPQADLGKLCTLIDIDRAQGFDADAGLRLAALLPPDATMVRAVARRLRLPNALRARLVAATGPGPTADWSDVRLRAAAYMAGAAVFRDRLRLAWAGASEALTWPGLWALALAFEPPKLPVTGADLMTRGFASGPDLGARLVALELAWIASDFRLDRAALLDAAGAPTPP